MPALQLATALRSPHQLARLLKEGKEIEFGYVYGSSV